MRVQPVLLSLMTHYRPKPKHDLTVKQTDQKFCVVLVDTKNSLNIGAVARVMDNFGFDDLRLVTPRSYEPEKIQAAACWAAEKVGQIRMFDNLELAIADAHDAIGFGTSYGRDRVSHISIGEWLPTVQGCGNRKIALVFGSEDQGLSNEQVCLLRSLVRIPSNSANPSMNLAQSVTVVLYELSKINWPASQESEEPAEMSVYSELQRKLDGIMELSGFMGENKPQAAPRVLHSLLRRLQLDKRELAIVLGLAAKVLNQLKRV